MGNKNKLIVSEFNAPCPWTGVQDAFGVVSITTDRGTFFVGQSKFYGKAVPNATEDECPELPYEARQGGQITAKEIEAVWSSAAKTAGVWDVVRPLIKKFKGNWFAAADYWFNKCKPHCARIRELQGKHSAAHGQLRIAEAHAIVAAGIPNPPATDDMTAARAALDEAETALDAAIEAFHAECSKHHKRVYDELMAFAKKQAGDQL